MIKWREHVQSSDFWMYIWKSRKFFKKLKKIGKIWTEQSLHHDELRNVLYFQYHVVNTILGMIKGSHDIYNCQIEKTFNKLLTTFAFGCTYTISFITFDWGHMLLFGTQILDE